MKKVICALGLKIIIKLSLNFHRLGFSLVMEEIKLKKAVGKKEMLSMDWKMLKAYSKI